MPWIRVSKTTTSTQNWSSLLSHFLSQSHRSPLPLPRPHSVSQCRLWDLVVGWLVRCVGTCPLHPEGAHQAAKDSPHEEQTHDFGCSGSPDTPQVTWLGGHRHFYEIPSTGPACYWVVGFFFSFSDSAILHIITITNDLHWVVQSHYCRYIWYLPLPICLSWGFIQWDMIELYSNLFPFK